MISEWTTVVNSRTTHQTPHCLFRDFSAFRCAPLRHSKPAQIKALQPKPESFPDAGRNALDVAHFVAQGKRPPSKFGLALCVTTPEGHAPRVEGVPSSKTGTKQPTSSPRTSLAASCSNSGGTCSKQLGGDLPENAPDPRGGA